MGRVPSGRARVTQDLCRQDYMEALVSREQQLDTDVEEEEEPHAGPETPAVARTTSGGGEPSGGNRRLLLLLLLTRLRLCAADLLALYRWRRGASAAQKLSADPSSRDRWASIHPQDEMRPHPLQQHITPPGPLDPTGQNLSANHVTAFTFLPRTSGSCSVCVWF